MAELNTDSTSNPALYNGRLTSFVIISCMMTAVGGIIFGYDIGISGGVTSMEPFLKKFFPEVHRRMEEGVDTSNYCKFDSQLLASFTSSLCLAGLVASLVASPVTQTMGRKASLLVGGAAFMAGSALGGAAVNVYMLILGRLLLGVGVGFSNQVSDVHPCFDTKCGGNNSSNSSCAHGRPQLERPHRFIVHLPREHDNSLSWGQQHEGKVMNGVVETETAESLSFNISYWIRRSKLMQLSSERKEIDSPATADHLD